MSGVFPDGFDPDEGPLFYLVCRAHHADVGGVTPGSMPLATSLKEEGVLLPPALLVNGGRVEEGLLRDFLARVRHPAEREGDLRAQIAPLDRGRERILDLLAQQGVEAFYARLEPLLDYGERVMRSVITSLPDGVYRFEDALDDAGLGGPPVPIRVTLRIHESEAKVDFRESADEVATGLNTVRSVACSATYYVFFCLVGEDYPVNAGCLRPLTVLTRPGSLLDAHRPAPVAAGNVETSQRVVDCLFGTLAQAAPDQIPAASSGSMNNVAVGSRDQEATSAYVY